MIVLNVKIDNFFAFKNFELNLSYPKKIVGSPLEEHLDGFSNFRYKKIIIIMGANATGKTTFGHMLSNIFTFLMSGNHSFLTKTINNPAKEASFSVDLVGNKARMQRIRCVFKPKTDRRYLSEDISREAWGEDIRERDSYESCCERLDKKIAFLSDVQAGGREQVDALSWYYTHSEDLNSGIKLPENSKIFPTVLETVMRSLDPSIKKVKPFKEDGIRNAYALYGSGDPLILQNGANISETYLSSGTKAGIQIAAILSSIIEHECSSYYCDEKFSYIHSEIEKTILSLMVDSIGANEQLFFTTHNTDILDLSLPKHAYVFFKKNTKDKECPIRCVCADDYLKRNTDVLKRAVENDLFLTLPQVDDLFALERLIK